MNKKINACDARSHLLGKSFNISETKNCNFYPLADDEHPTACEQALHLGEPREVTREPHAKGEATARGGEIIETFRF